MRGPKGQEKGQQGLLVTQRLGEEGGVGCSRLGDGILQRASNQQSVGVELSFHPGYLEGVFFLTLFRVCRQPFSSSSSSQLVGANCIVSFCIFAVPLGPEPLPPKKCSKPSTYSSFL